MNADFRIESEVYDMIYMKPPWFWPKDFKFGLFLKVEFSILMLLAVFNSRLGVPSLDRLSLKMQDLKDILADDATISSKAPFYWNNFDSLSIQAMFS